MENEMNGILSAPYTRIQAKERQLEPFWRSFDERFERSVSSLEVRRLEIAGLSIQLECRSPNLLKYLDIQFSGCLVEKFTKTDAVFRVWKDEIEACLPPGCPVEKLLVECDSIPLIKAEKEAGRIHAFDRTRNRGYFCIRDDSDAAVIEQGYLLYRLFYSLAKNTGRLMLHAGVIGYENKGVLICGNCGYGKSTLCLSSLLENCQYVGDDRAMFTHKGGSTIAWPVYSIASLFPAILERLPNLQIGPRWQKYGTSKLVFDLSRHQDQFSSGLPIEAVLFPRLSLDANEPSISEIDPGPVLAHLIWSTITQVDDRKDSRQICTILNFFKNLPCYEIKLTEHVERNAKFLKDFLILKMKGEK